MLCESQLIPIRYVTFHKNEFKEQKITSRRRQRCFVVILGSMENEQQKIEP